MENILTMKELTVSFKVYGGTVQAVRGLSMEIKEGEILALVGESGCGKSAAAQAVLGLHEKSSVRIKAEALDLSGVDILNASEKEMRQVRGHLASMVFQDPMTCLNPTMKVGRQVVEALYRNKTLPAAACKEEAVRLLETVQIPNAKVRAEQYPHEFSGGMRQRIMLATALAGTPRLLIADEPTTALDVTIQLQILKLIAKIQKETKMSVLLITHDFGVVANIADRVAVMYAGKIVEEGTTMELFSDPVHPYTKGLLKSLPTPGIKGRLYSIPGEPPDLYAPPAGCAFADRCEECMDRCKKENPPLQNRGGGHKASCWKYNIQDAKGE